MNKNKQPLKMNAKSNKNPDTPLSQNSLFKEAFKDVTPLKQDKITPPSRSGKGNPGIPAKKSAIDKSLKRAAASFHFSDGFEAYFPEHGPLKYTRPGTETFEVKRLRRGEYPPELILDLHGLNKEQSKLEIAALIIAAQQQHAHCVCIVHGVGARVLKKAVPNWLVQHPAVLGFHQAPLEWGGDGALLVLIENPLNLEAKK